MLIDSMQKLGFTNRHIKIIFYFDILTLCARGYSNKEIAEYTGLLENDIEEVLLELLDFSGWKDKQQDFLDMYLKKDLTNLNNDGIIVCEKLIKLEREVDSLYGKTN